MASLDLICGDLTRGGMKTSLLEGDTIMGIPQFQIFTNQRLSAWGVPNLLLVGCCRGKAAMLPLTILETDGSYLQRLKGNRKDVLSSASTPIWMNTGEDAAIWCMIPTTTGLSFWA